MKILLGLLALTITAESHQESIEKTRSNLSSQTPVHTPQEFEEAIDLFHEMEVQQNGQRFLLSMPRTPVTIHELVH
jgi:hypothetical protein